MAYTVFLSYAHEDEPYREQLSKHLSALRRAQLIEDWYDGQLLPGQEWEPQIFAQLHAAHIILLLISADFLASDFCYDREMQLALDRHDQGNAVVIPILVRPCDWEHTRFAKLQVLPSTAIPVEQWTSNDDAFTNIVQELRRVIDHLQAMPPTSSTTSNNEQPREKTFWNVPPRNPFFTGREAILLQVQTMLQADRTAAVTQPPAISGFGGIGKTQIAIEYAHRSRETYQHVFWVRAETMEELASDFTSIARILVLPERDAKEQIIILHAVKRWLESHQDWLLILDNADELAVVAPYLPQGTTGHLLLTTRATVMSGLAKKVQLDIMSGDEAMTLLLRRADILSQGASLETLSQQTLSLAHEIVNELAGHPLALDQAGAYIEETGTNLTRYLTLYRSQAAYRKQLLAHRGGILPSHPLSVSATIFMALKKVSGLNPHAKAIVEVCIFLASDAIPEFLLLKGAQHLGPDVQALAQDPLAFDAALSVLCNYSLLRRDGESEQVSMHRLVQVVLQDEMDPETQRQWAERVVTATSAVFPTSDIQTWQTCQILLPHALVCATLIEQWQIATNVSARLLNQIAFYLHDRADYSQALPLYQRALAIREQVVGPEHPDTANSLNNLALLYKNQGNYREALPLYERALAIYEQVVGPEHPDTANSLNNLATLYVNQGNYREAVPLLQRALAIREQVVGPEHPDTAQSLNNLAALYVNQGNYSEALPLYERALAIREQVVGPEHPDTAQSLNNLAALYVNQGNYREALPLHKQALAIREQVVGTEHPDTANSLNNLAALYHNQGNYSEALPLYERALAICEKVLGPEHPDTAQSINNLAALYVNQGNYSEALPLYERALAICEKVLGPEHPTTKMVRDNYESCANEQ